MTWGSFIVEETEACIANSVSKTCLLCAQPFLLRGWQCFRSLLRIWYSSWAIFSHPCIFAFSPTAQFSSVAQLCLTLCDLVDCSTLGFPIISSQSLLKLISIDSVMLSNHLIICCPLLPSVFPSIRVFSNESTLHIRWPEDWSFSVSISPSNDHSGLISLRMDWLNLCAVQGTVNSLTAWAVEVKKLLTVAHCRLSTLRY